MSRFVKSVRAEMAKSLYTTESWSEQIKEAVVLSGGVDDETGEDIEPTAFDSVMHSLSLFWKVRARAARRATPPAPAAPR